MNVWIYVTLQMLIIIIITSYAIVNIVIDSARLSVGQSSDGVRYYKTCRRFFFLFFFFFSSRNVNSDFFVESAREREYFKRIRLSILPVNPAHSGRSVLIKINVFPRARYTIDRCRLDQKSEVVPLTLTLGAADSQSSFETSRVVKRCLCNQDTFFRFKPNDEDVCFFFTLHNT